MEYANWRDCKPTKWQYIALSKKAQFRDKKWSEWGITRGQASDMINADKSRTPAKSNKPNLDLDSLQNVLATLGYTITKSK